MATEVPTFDGVVKDTDEKMEKALTHLEDELRKIRSGRATPGLVENIRAEYYGSPTPLGQLASISIPEPRLIVIKPFDKGSIGDIEKAILKSDIGLTPQNDGKLVRISVPPLSEERRKQLVTQIKKMAEQGRVAIRNIRRDQNKFIESSQKQGHFTEDDRDKLKSDVQDLTKKFEDQVNEMAKTREGEVMDG